MPVQVMPASFDELADASKSAARNQRLVDACDVLVAFWDGASKGTRATVDRALDSGKEVHVFVANLTGFMAVALAVRVRFFARLREQAGTDSESVEVERGSTVADVYDALRKAHPALDPNRESVRVAVNQEFGDWDVIVAAGDEIAFIPPGSGGPHAGGVLFEVTTHPRRGDRAVPVGDRPPQGVGAGLEEGACRRRHLLDRGRRLEAGFLVLYARDRYAVPERDDHALQSRVLRHELVVERDVAGLLIVGLDDLALTQRVVSDQQPTTVESLHAQVECLLGDFLGFEAVEQVYEASVESRVQLFQAGHRVILQHNRLLRQAGGREVGARSERALVIDLVSGQEPARRSPKQPDAAVPDSSPQLENPLGARDSHEQVEQSP